MPTQQPRLARLKWWAISVGTIIVTISYWLMVYSFVAAETEGGPPVAPALSLGLALVPLSFVAVAAISRRPALGGATVAAMLLFVAIGLPVLTIARDAVSGLVAGFGAGGIASLRREVHQRWQARSWAVVGATTFTFLVIRLIPPFGLIVAPIITLPSLGVADIFVDRSVRAERDDEESL